MKEEYLKNFASQVRRDIVRMVHAQNSGHPGGSLGCVEYFTALYNEIMNHNTNFNMDGQNEDLFFLSNGHISPVYYSTLARCGYFPISELSTLMIIVLFTPSMEMENYKKDKFGKLLCMHLPKKLTT